MSQIVVDQTQWRIIDVIAIKFCRAYDRQQKLFGNSQGTPQTRQQKYSKSL